MHQHVTRPQFEWDGVVAVEQLLVGEALELDVADQVVPGDREQAPGLDRGVSTSTWT
jgi:hypothetical protein